MKITDLPLQVRPQLYDAAMRAYAAKVAKRARAVYRTGNINFPGLSDLDIVVVPGRRHADNAQYFSALYRLPAIYQGILLHDPFVIPAEHKNVLRYTTHRNLQFVSGEDLLQDVAFVDSPAERWCKLLEGLCSYTAFIKAAQTTGHARGRRIVPKASSLRFTLRQMDALSGSHYASEYERTIDTLRAGYYSSDPMETLLAVWDVFYDAYLTVGAWLRTTLALERDEALDDFARRVFCGAAQIRDVPADYVLARSAEINDYYEAVARLRIPFGQIFFWEAYFERGHKHRENVISNLLYRMKYKIERVLTPAPAV
jgi:hypothetical protein